MANEVQFRFLHGATCYFLVWSRTGTVWNTSTVAFETYNSNNFSNYTITASELGTAGAVYQGSFPSSITAGVYGLDARQQLTGSAAETDPTIAVATEFHWNGTVVLPRSDLATSGQVGQFLPMRLYRGQMIQNFPFYLVSSADHSTGFTSGQVSGQIVRDPVSGSTFGPLQSGQFAEVGNGWYTLLSFTSGDLLANTAAVMFNAVNLSGGSADSRNFTFVLQRTSGQG